MKGLVRRSFERAAETYDESAALVREVGDRLRERLDYIKLAPRIIVDAGCATGNDGAALATLYPAAAIIAIDLALAMLKRSRAGMPLCCDLQQLPLASASVDLIWSNLTLPWCDLDAAFDETRRVLAPGGLLIFSTLGPDTLKELRTAWRDRYAHVDSFIDMHDIGDALVRNGLREPVMERDEITLTYASLGAALAELRAQGSRNLSENRRRGLGGRNALRDAECDYPRSGDGRSPATFEVIYGHAWRAQSARTEARPVKIYARRPWQS